MKSWALLTVLLCCGYFLAAGVIIAPYAGFQHDEVVFAEPIYQHGVTFYSHKLGEMHVPLMINSYAGALKTWLYYPIFAMWAPSPYSLRVPTILIAALAMALFWPVMVRAGGRRAAVITMVLIATDTMYLITSVFDWGPVALQHLFLVAVMWAFIRFHESGNTGMLALAAFLSGLALWEKALFFWLAGGLFVACMAIYPVQVLRRISVRNIVVAALAFLLGAFPFVLYNIHKPNSTLGENATFSAEEFDLKVEVARRTINGHAVFGYLVFDDWMAQPRSAESPLESASLALRGATGVSQQNWMMWAFGLAILCSPFTWRTRVFRPTLFAVIFSLVGWALMLATRGAGASVHHVILLWPVSLMFVGLTFSEASRRLPRRVAISVLCVVVGVFAAENVLATNQYLAQFIRNGPTTIWTNAMYPLSDHLMQTQYPEVDGIDWGTIVPLRVLDQGKLNLDTVTVDEAHPEQAIAKLEQPGVVFLAHVKGLEVFPDVDAKMDKIAASRGYTKDLLRVFKDENERPVFELFRYRK